MLLSCAGMLSVVCAETLLSLYLSIELQALAFYILAGYKRNSLISVEAGLKYFSLSAMASGMLLFGITVIYYSTGTINLSEISSILDTLYSIPDFTVSSSYIYPPLIGFFFILAAFLFKLPAAPFHMWAADVYEGSPTASTVFFLSVPKFALFSVLVSLLYKTFYSFFFFYQPVLLFISALSFFIGYFSALNQISMKRFFVYSGVSHVGFMLLSLGALDLHGDGTHHDFHSPILESKTFSLFFYLISYSVMVCASMLFILLGSGKLQKSTNRLSHYSLRDLPMNYNNPAYSFFILCLFFSFIGIPPTLGFFSKFFILKESMAWSSSLTLFLILFIIITFSGFVYGRIIAYMFFRNISLSSPRYWWNSIYPSAIWSRLFVTLCLLTILFFLYPKPLLFLAESISSSLYQDYYFTTYQTWEGSPEYDLFIHRVTLGSHRAVKVWGGFEYDMYAFK
jgi:NADH-quinone oxidoreductase subunit N